MASRGARQRLKGGGSSGGDTAPAADKLREQLGSREAGGAEHRPEYECGRGGGVAGSGLLAGSLAPAAGSGALFGQAFLLFRED